MELLWENASPSSNFAAQTVSVPAFNGYTGYAVLFAEANDARLANTRTTFAPVGKTVVLEVVTTNTTVRAVRSCSNSGTKFIFGDSEYAGVTGAVATVIPLKLFGVNGMFE